MTNPNSNQKRVRSWVFALAGGVAYLLLGVLLWWALDRYINPGDSTEKKDLVQALGFIMAGVAGAIGIYFTWRGQRQAREAQEENQRSTQEQIRLARQSQEQNQKNTQAQLENAQEELRLTRQGQITERFTRAIEQLGATDDKGEMKLEIRLGGIYALERIDKESPERDYHSTVMEVLTAYVRENTHQGPGPSKGASEAASTANEATAEEDEGSNQPAPPKPHRPTADIQAILDVLGRAQAHVPVEHRTRLDLHEADLKGADLRGANLQEADLLGAFLQGAILWRANLRGTDLVGAYLQRAILQGAFLHEANLQRAFLQGAFLRGAFLLGANLKGAILWRADLQEADLVGANLQEANLQEAILQGADLRGADLVGAILHEADLQGAFLQGAFLQGAFLQGARRLRQEQIEWTIGPNETNPLHMKTELPEGLNRPELWSKSIEEQKEIVKKLLRRLRGH